MNSCAWCRLVGLARLDRLLDALLDLRELLLDLLDLHRELLSGERPNAPERKSGAQ
jgi:hypothetical protein